MITPQQRAEFLALQPYKCYMCEGLIGMRTDEKLYIGAAIFELSVTITCGYCSRHTHFRPISEKDNKKSKKLFI